MKTITKTEVNEKLHYLMGERQIPQGSVVDREAFVQDGFEMAWADYDWDESMKETTITVTNGVGNMPSDYMSGGKVRLWLGRNREFRIAAPEQLEFNPGEELFRVKFDHDDIRHQIVCAQDGTFKMIYKLEPPELDDNGTPFPSSALVARAGLIMAKESFSPGRANVQQEYDLYRDELKRQRAVYNRRTNARRGKTLAETKGHYTGKVGG